jgi:hypothetical protein
MTMERELALNLVVIHGQEPSLGHEPAATAGLTLVSTAHSEAAKASAATMLRSFILKLASWVLPVCGWFR